MSRRSPGPGRGPDQPRADPRPDARHPALRGAPRPAPATAASATNRPGSSGASPASTWSSRPWRRPGEPHRAVDDRQRRAAVGAGRRRPPRPRAGRLLRLVRPTRSGGTSASSAASIRSASPPPTTSTRSWRCEPDCVVYNPMWPDADELVRILEAGVNVVSTAAFINGNAARRRARPHRSTPCERGGSSMFGTGISPGFVELIGIADRRHLRPHRQDHDRRGVRHHALRLARHRAALRASAGPSTTPSCPGMAARAPRCSARPSPWSPTPSASSSTTSSARPSTRRPPRTSSWTRGPSRRLRRRRRPPAGRAGSATAPSSSSTSGGRRARPSTPTGRSRRATSSRSTAAPPCRSRSSTSRRPTSRRPPSPTSWCSG